MTFTLDSEAHVDGDPSTKKELASGDLQSRDLEHGHLPDEMVQDLAEMFKLLADETRLRILFLLYRRNELNVRTLCQALRQSQPAVSHHLALLRSAGLIAMRRAGKHNFYRLLPRRFEKLLGVISTAVPGGQTETPRATCWSPAVLVDSFPEVNLSGLIVAASD
jgi:DNA-binding transcriptional ArsR family regulator